jgi:hypothetical protein
LSRFSKNRTAKTARQVTEVAAAIDAMLSAKGG